MDNQTSYAGWVPVPDGHCAADLFPNQPYEYITQIIPSPEGLEPQVYEQTYARPVKP